MAGPEPMKVYTLLSPVAAVAKLIVAKLIAAELIAAELTVANDTAASRGSKVYARPPLER